MHLFIYALLHSLDIEADRKIVELRGKQFILMTKKINVDFFESCNRIFTGPNYSDNIRWNEINQRKRAIFALNSILHLVIICANILTQVYLPNSVHEMRYGQTRLLFII